MKHHWLTTALLVLAVVVIACLIVGTYGMFGLAAEIRNGPEMPAAFLEGFILKSLVIQIRNWGLVFGLFTLACAVELARRWSLTVKAHENEQPIDN